MASAGGSFARLAMMAIPWSVDSRPSVAVPCASASVASGGLNMKIFVSYCHRQEAWVLDALLPCLKAAGAELLVDRERFKAGRAVLGQMDALQDQAERTLLVLTQEYLASDYCRHELKRAVVRDPEFREGRTLPLVLSECVTPPELARAEPLFIDMRASASASGSASEPWRLLFDACGVELGCSAPRWLAARDELVTLLRRNQSVNLVVPHRAGATVQPRWKGLVEHLKESHFMQLGCVDLERGRADSREELVSVILEELGMPQPVPDKPKDLGLLDRALRGNCRAPSSCGRALRSDHALFGGVAPRVDGASHSLALLHFDLAVPRQSEYGIDFFAALRNLNEERCVTFLLQSRRPFMDLVPRDHPLSHMQLATVELDGS
jgi:hypothetical protein